MPDRLMYDAVNVATIPADAGMVAGYVDGGYITVPELRRRFPHARLVTITVTGDATADVIDVEKGDAGPQKAVAWVRAMRSKGRRPIVYTSKDNVSTLLASFAAEGEHYPLLWIADWTGEPHLNTGAVATQYASPTVPPPSGPIAYDVSVVSPNWPESVQPKKGGSVNLDLNYSTIYRALALAGSVLGVIVGLGNQLHLPTAVRSVLVAASGVILWIEHHKVTASTPPKPPAPPANG